MRLLVRTYITLPIYIYFISGSVVIAIVSNPTCIVIGYDCFSMYYVRLYMLF